MIVQVVNRGGAGNSYRLQTETIMTAIDDVVCLQAEDRDGNVVSVTLEPNDLQAIADARKAVRA